MEALDHALLLLVAQAVAVCMQEAGGGQAARTGSIAMLLTHRQPGVGHREVGDAEAQELHAQQVADVQRRHAHYRQAGRLQVDGLQVQQVAHLQATPKACSCIASGGA
jgi:hypothetical protein